jgi:hypothetical protein
MKYKFWEGVGYFFLGFLIAMIVAQVRGTRVDYYVIGAIFLLYFFSGIIMRKFEKKIGRLSFLFLLPAIGILLYASFNNPPAIIKWIVEASVMLPSYFIGYQFFQSKGMLRWALAGSWLIFVVVVCIALNP